MEIYINAITVGTIWVLAALFFWKVYPLIKDTALYRKAVQIVNVLEEDIGAGNGQMKFDNAVAMLQEWVDKLGWQIDVGLIMDTITGAVGELHTKQGKAPKPMSEKILTVDAEDDEMPFADEDDAEADDLDGFDHE